MGALTPLVNSTGPLIGVVGTCKSGKSTLVRGLIENGYRAQQIAQEHSFAPRMWQQITPPDILIYLHSDYERTVERGLAWTQREYDEQQPRLAHARENANLELVTNVESPEEILAKAIEFLTSNSN